MAVTRTKSEEFQRLAQECRATAQTLSTEQARAEMLGMAEVCDRVAAQQTHGTVSLSVRSFILPFRIVAIAQPARY
jgi:pyruvate-formate lyase